MKRFLRGISASAAACEMLFAAAIVLRLMSALAFMPIAADGARLSVIASDDVYSPLLLLLLAFFGYGRYCKIADSAGLPLSKQFLSFSAYGAVPSLFFAAADILLVKGAYTMMYCGTARNFVRPMLSENGYFRTYASGLTESMLFLLIKTALLYCIFFLVGVGARYVLTKKPALFAVQLAVLLLYLLYFISDGGSEPSAPQTVLAVLILLTPYSALFCPHWLLGYGNTPKGTLLLLLAAVASLALQGLFHFLLRPRHKRIHTKGGILDEHTL